jgi:hypothetical protein
MLLDSVTQVITMIEKLHKKHQPVNILVSVAKLGNLSTIARKRTVKMLRDIPYDKVAVYGPSTFNKALINLVIHAAGKHKEVRIFADKAEAQQWLIGKR